MGREVKVCGMTMPEQIARIEDADYFGMIFYKPSPRNAFSLNPELLTADMPKRVGVFVNESFEVIVDAIDRYGLDVIQLHGDETTDSCNAIKSVGIEVWKAVSVAGADDIKLVDKYAPFVDRILLDTKTLGYGGAGNKFDWSLLGDYNYDVPFMLAGGIAPGDEAVLINFQHPMLIGFDINSKFELSPGVKNVSAVNNFIRRIKSPLSK